MMKDKRVIGIFRLKEDHTFRQGYETASWYTDVLVKEGDYPLYLGAWDWDDNRLAKYLYAECPGIVVGSMFIDRLFQYRTAHKDEDVGKNFIKTVSLDGWTAARYLLDGYYSGCPFELILNDEFEARVISYDDGPGFPCIIEKAMHESIG